MRTNAERIRKVLKGTNGLTATQIAERIGKDVDIVRVVLNQTYGIYIERWELTQSGHGYVAIWNAVEVPQNAIRPDRPKVDRKVYDAEYRKRRKSKEKSAQARPKTTWVTTPPWAAGAQA